MLRTAVSLLLALALAGSCASAAVLPVDTETYPEAQTYEGDVVLQWDGPVLPARTEYELLETVVTDFSMTLGKCEEPGHKFALISYRNANGEQQKAWVMDYNLNRVQSGVYVTEETALAYARRFFGNQYILALKEDSEITLTHDEPIWLAELKDASGHVTHTLYFTDGGLILDYRDLSVELPTLEGGFHHVDELGAAAAADGATAMLEWMSRELLPQTSFESVATFGYDAKQSMYSFSLNGAEELAMVLMEPEMRVASYTDLSRPDARYGTYLTANEAIAIAQEQLFSGEYGLSPEEADLYTVTYTELGTQKADWLTVDVSLPYWHMVFTDTENGSMEFDAVVDAITGDVLYIAESAGNG